MTYANLAGPLRIASQTINNNGVCEGALGLQVREILRLWGLILSHVERERRSIALECRRFRGFAFTWFTQKEKRRARKPAKKGIRRGAATPTKAPT